VASKVFFVAFALMLVHGSIFFAAKMNSATLASSLGLCLNLLGGFLLGSTVVE
jgi:hypothetical protein